MVSGFGWPGTFKCFVYEMSQRHRTADKISGIGLNVSLVCYCDQDDPPVI